jgi:imidazoleglycerol-phosphate dehydratase/histidinol-phosphatase
MRKLLFIDRDGTLVREPDDFQVDRIDKVKLVDGVIPALRRLVDAGYQLVMVSNQDGLGTVSFPQEDFEITQAFILELFRSQGIEFADIRICPHVDADNCDCRKPKPGLLLDYLRKGGRDGFDREYSAVIGDRDTDIRLAEALGVRGFKLAGFEGDGLQWNEIAAEILDAPRRATVERTTKETRITAHINLDDDSRQAVSSGIGFFDHMLESLARHGGFSLQLSCEGDLHIDEHHTVEDCALTIGAALDKALGERRGISRFGFLLPMDETRAMASIDLSGRPYFVLDGSFPRESVGGLHTEMVPHFFRSLAEAARMALHIEVQGENTHHMVESCFKATGRALRQAVQREESARRNAVPSTKGVL